MHPKELQVVAQGLLETYAPWHFPSNQQRF